MLRVPNFEIYSRVSKIGSFFLYFRVRGKAQHSDPPSFFIGSPPWGVGISTALFCDQINIFAICICGKTGVSREGNTVQPKVIWFGFRSIGNSVWTKLPK